MGVAGLASSLEKLATVCPISSVNNAILYIDGLNLVGGISAISQMKESTKADFRKRAVKAVQAKMRPIKQLPWKKIYMVFDAYYPIEKVKTKITRKRQAIWKKPHLSAMSEILRYLIDEETSIELIFSGLEGEAAIVQHIYENQQDRTSKRFILSDDSDIYTFDLPLKRLIFGVSTDQIVHGNIRSIKVLQFGKVWDSIPSNRRIKLPLDYIPESVFNPTLPIRNKVQCLNLISSHNKLIEFKSPFVTPELTGTHELGLFYRKAKYRLIADEFFHGRDFTIIEYIEKDFDIVETTVQKATEEEFAQVIEDLMTLPIETLVYNELKRVQKDLGFSNKEINSVYAFLADLIRGKCTTGMAPSFRTFQAKALLEALLAAISSLVSFAQIDRDIRRFVQISEFELCKYIV
ncbi:hypothetical protein B9G98_03622 [Wickerhamiella sorbophila]|uniref:Uncharacterized protein n=1 Tax=Wickerhamiella sorbophila TaxID=45607 RepID=A0A2T0FLZ3_9ASCO|nr:hypothetical protein B9G98_03622 [Wickerhamiella sorbophila]PRT56002.1 hypothetical protein B9G98_03622 [Wickerhamiella sorbophila]